MPSRHPVAAAYAALRGRSAAAALTSSRITFSRVVTEPGLGNLERVNAVAELKR